MKILTEHKNKILFLVLAIAAFLRFVRLGSMPPSLTVDETALGYNAYSILHTARDEHGRFMPIIFESFGDWKPGLYIYLTVPFVALFGLNEFSTRAVGAISGVVAIWIIYLVIHKMILLGGNYGHYIKKKDLLGFRELASLSGALLLAVSPWHLQFTRGAWESALSFTFVLTGVYFFLKFVEGKSRGLWLATVFFGLTLWTYQGAKLSTSIVVLLLVLLWKDNLFKAPGRVLLKAGFVGFILAVPVLLSIFQGKAGRLEVFSVFSYARSEVDIQALLTQGNESRNSASFVLYHPEWLNFTRGVVARWTNHFSGKFLFFEGDWASKRHNPPDMGMLLFVDAVLLLAGIWVLVKLGRSKLTYFVWGWLLLSPLPAALSRDSVHAVRAFNMVGVITIVAAIGASYLILKLINTRRLFRYFLSTILLLVYAFNFVYYLDQYWVHAPYKSSQYWDYGYKEIAQEVFPRKDSYDNVVVAQSYAQPYIYFLYYQKYPPLKYQQQVKKVFEPSPFGDVGLVTKLDNIEFRDINWSSESRTPGTLMVIKPEAVPLEDFNNRNDFNMLKQITALNGKPIYYVIETLSQ